MRPRALAPLSRKLLDAARVAAGRAAVVLRHYAADRAALEWEAKTHTDFVTVADRAAEAAVRGTLLERVPAARIVAEEGSPGDAVDTGVTFVVDPLDGTTNFLHGFPWYGVSIGALVEGVLVAGVVLNVPTGEMFTATLGGGAFRGIVGRRARQPIRVSEEREPGRSLVGTGLPFKHAHHIDPYIRSLPRILPAVAGLRRAGAAVLDLCDVACGRFDAFWELELAPWDVAAGLLIAREAGAVVTDLDGRPATVGTGPIVAGNPTMHAWLLEQLRGTAEAMRA